MGTNRDWIFETIAHRQTERVPYNFMFSPPARAVVEKCFGAAPIEEKLNFPIRMSAPESIKPLYADPKEFGRTIEDEFGVIWSTSAIDRGSPIGNPLKKPSLSEYKLPDPADSYRFENLRRWCRQNREHFTIIWVGDLWERATFMRGMENILTEVALNPKFVRELLQRIADYILETMRILFERFGFDGIALSDDYGGQKGMLMSPDDWRKLIKPPLERIYSYAKQNGRVVFHHSCGNIHPVVGDMIDIGLDILHPIQPEAMDIYRLKREFGQDLTFCGGIPTQQLLPKGTPEEVRDEVKKLKEKMGAGGGYILEPGITLQADILLENLAIMLDEAMAER